MRLFSVNTLLRLPQPLQNAQYSVSSELSTVLANRFLAVLKRRFEAHRERHPGIQWSAVQAKLLFSSAKLSSLYAMETTGGEPDVVAPDCTSSVYSFFDCSPDSPAGRRFLCYDYCGQLCAAREYATFLDVSGLVLPVRGNVIDMASSMGICILTPDDYRTLQTIGCFDKKTSSLLWTHPEDKKVRGPFVGYVFGGKVRIQRHSDAYYSADMGFRGKLDV